MDLDFAAQLMKLWPIFLGFITLVIVLAKMHATIQVLEEKVKVAFQLMIVSNLFQAFWFVFCWIMFGLYVVYLFAEMIILSALNVFRSIYRR